MLLAIGMVLVAANLRPAAAGVGPLIHRIKSDTGLSDGGLTPSAALSEAAAELAEVHVLVLQQLARNWDGSDLTIAEGAVGRCVLAR